MTHQSTANFTLRFQTEHKYISSQLFFASVTSSEIIVTNLQQVLGVNFTTSPIIFHSDSGSFIQKFGLVLSFCGGIIVTPLAGDFVKGFTEELLGRPMTHYGANVGEFVKDYWKFFLTTPQEKLSVLIPTALNLDKSLKAKSDFYTALCNDYSIDSVNFGEVIDGGLVYRSDFAQHTVNDIHKELDDIFEYKILQIYKPILEKKYKAKWGFIDQQTNIACGYHVDDQDFRFKVFTGLLPLKQSSKIDVIKCKVKIKRKMINGEEMEISRHIVEVYTFNNKNIRPIPMDFDPKVIIKSPNKKYLVEQCSLFNLL